MAFRQCVFGYVAFGVLVGGKPSRTADTYRAVGGLVVGHLGRAERSAAEEP